MSSLPGLRRRRTDHPARSGAGGTRVPAPAQPRQDARGGALGGAGGSAAASGRSSAAGPPRGPTRRRGTARAPGVRALRDPRAPLPLPVPRGPRKAPVWTPDPAAGRVLPAPRARAPRSFRHVSGMRDLCQGRAPAALPPPRGRSHAQPDPELLIPPRGRVSPGSTPPAARESCGTGPGRAGSRCGLGRGVDGVPDRGSAGRQQVAAPRLRPGLGTLVPGSTPATVSVRCRGCNGPVPSGLEEDLLRSRGVTSVPFDGFGCCGVVGSWGLRPDR